MLITVLVLVPHSELFGAGFELSGQVARGLVHLRPRTVRQHLDVELNAIDLVLSTDALIKVLLDVFAQDDILGHAGHLLHLSGTAFDLQLLDHLFLVLVRD